MNGQDKKLLHGSVTIRSPRSVLLLNPYQLSVVLTLLAVSVVFTFWPETLEHSPLSFEERGVVHHVWHYTLLVGSLLTLVGMMSVRRWRLKAELIGLVLMIGALGMNLTAMVADALAANSAESSLSGVGIGVRLAVILGHTIRAYTVATEPTVDLRETNTSVGG